MWDGVPWAIGAGARNSAETGRLLVFLATGGQEGVINSTDLAVKALDVPGTKVRVLSGAGVIRNRALGGESQSYAVRNAGEDVIDVAPTGSSGARSDLVIANVENNTISGEPWPVPPSIEDGPYIQTRIIANVPAGTLVVPPNLGYSAIPLARLDIPANTGTIMPTMIKDLRMIVNTYTGGKTEDDETEIPGDGDDGDNDDGDPLTNTDTAYLDWPYTATYALKIPAWATHANLLIVIENIQVRNGDMKGVLRMVLGAIVASEKGWKIDWPNATARQNISASYIDLPIPAAMRGTTQTFKLQAKAAAGLGLARLLSTDSTKVRVSAEFKQKTTTT